MSEKLKPNFTAIPNVIFDQIMRALNEGEFKLLMAICRYTYGWRKQSDRISLKQLADLTGMDRSNVARARNRLASRGLVEVTPGGPVTASTYRLKIEISDTDLAAVGSDRSTNPGRGSDPSATSDRSTTSGRGSDPSATFQRKPKKECTPAAKLTSDSHGGERVFVNSSQIRPVHRRAGRVPPELQSIVCNVVGRLNELAGTGYDPDSEIVCRLVARLKEGAAESDCIAVVEDRWRQWRNTPAMRQHFNPDTLFRESNFEKYLNAARMNGAHRRTEREFVNA